MTSVKATSMEQAVLDSHCSSKTSEENLTIWAVVHLSIEDNEGTGERGVDKCNRLKPPSSVI